MNWSVGKRRAAPRFSGCATTMPSSRPRLWTRLLDLAAAFGVPFDSGGHPRPRYAGARRRRLADRPNITVAVHGWAHQNHAGDGKETGTGPAPAQTPLSRDLARGLARIRSSSASSQCLCSCPLGTGSTTRCLPTVPVSASGALRLRACQDYPAADDQQQCRHHRLAWHTRLPSNRIPCRRDRQAAGRWLQWRRPGRGAERIIWSMTRRRGGFWNSCWPSRTRPAQDGSRSMRRFRQLGGRLNFLLHGKRQLQSIARGERAGESGCPPPFRWHPGRNRCAPDRDGTAPGVSRRLPWHSFSLAARSNGRSHVCAASPPRDRSSRRSPDRRPSIRPSTCWSSSPSTCSVSVT